MIVSVYTRCIKREGWLIKHVRRDRRADGWKREGVRM